MGNPNTTVRVNLRADPGPAPGTVAWNSTVSFHPPGPGHGNGNRFEITAPGEAEILFDLDDRSGLQLRFRPSANEAFWIQQGTSCPNGPGDGGGQFAVDRVQNTRLTVTDFHTDSDEYCYALRFDSNQGLQVFDPIIKN